MRSREQYLCALALFGVVTLLKFAFPIIFTERTPLLFFPMLVLVCAWFFDLGPGIMVTFLSSILIGYFLILDSEHGIVIDITKTLLCGISLGFCLYVVWHIKESEIHKHIVNALDGLKDYGVFTINDDAKITSVNCGGEKLHLYDAKELIGSDWTRLFTGEDIRANLPSHILDLAKTNGHWIGRCWRTRKNGTWFWASSILVKLPVGFYCMVSDITSQKQSDEDLQRWKHIFYDCGWAAAISDAQTDIMTHVNEAFASMHGYSREELINKPLAVMFAPEFLVEIPKHIQAANRSDKDYIYDSVHMHKDGCKFPCRSHVSIFRDNIGKPLYRATIYQDITEQKRTERNLRQVSEDRRLITEQKDDFVATLAHELRSPLSALKLNLHLYKHKQSKATDNKMMELFERNINQIQKLVDDLMDAVRLNKEKFHLNKSVFDLRDVIVVTVEQSYPYIKGKDQKLRIALPTEPVHVDADPSRIEQIFTNLLSNAAKYTHAGGNIWLTAEIDDGSVLVKIKDNGIGIDQRMLSVVFDPYTQVNTKYSHGGLGLGLHLVKRLVNLHGGTVSAHSDGPNTGSMFLVRLPMTTTEPSAILPNKAFNGDLHDLKVLIVDDNIDAAKSMQMMLAMDGCEVALAHDGEEALKVYKDFQPQVVLLDIGLPKLNGYEVARTIREKDKHTVIITVTGFGQQSDIAHSKEVGVNHHVVKPVDPDYLKKLIQTTIEGSSIGIKV